MITPRIIRPLVGPSYLVSVPGTQNSCSWPESLSQMQPVLSLNISIRKIHGFILAIHHPIIKNLCASFSTHLFSKHWICFFIFTSTWNSFWHDLIPIIMPFSVIFTFHILIPNHNLSYSCHFSGVNISLTGW